MSGLAGTGALVRLALRRDRVKLPAWILGTGLLTYAQTGAMDEVLDTPASREAYAATFGASAAARMFGAVDGTSPGSLMTVKLYGFIAIVVALACAMLVVRHTRQNEDTGRLELVRAARVGRLAPLAAALLVALGAAAAFGLVEFLALAAHDGVDATGAAIVAASWAGIGIVFASAAAVAAQVAPSARLANEAVGVLVAVAFVLHACGTVLGEVSADATSVRIGWVSWLSPLGWGQLAYPFSEQRWWPLACYVVAAAASALLAFALTTRRDFGSGMLPQRRARATASPRLAGPLGLALRLDRATALSWFVGIVALGAVGGAFATAIDDIVGSSSQAQHVFDTLGGSSALLDAYLSVMLTYLVLLGAAAGVQIALRLRVEERRRGDVLLALPLARARWMVTHLGVAAVVASASVLVGGASMAVIGSAVGAPVDVGGVLLDTLAQLPALLVYVAAVALGFGISSRLAGAFGWGLVGLSAVLVFAELVDLSDWVFDLSPLRHVPQVGDDHLAAGPLLALAAVALAATLAGLAALRRRDVAAA